MYRVLFLNDLEIHQEREAQRPVVHILAGIVLPGCHAQTVVEVTIRDSESQVCQIVGTRCQTVLREVERIVGCREVLAGVVVVTEDTPGEIGLVAIDRL